VHLCLAHNGASRKLEPKKKQEQYCTHFGRDSDKRLRKIEICNTTIAEDKADEKKYRRRSNAKPHCNARNDTQQKKETANLGNNPRSFKLDYCDDG
jgi:hypothetical protein